MFKKQLLVLLSTMYIVVSTTAQTKWSSYYSANSISALLYHQNNIWVGTFGAGLIKINTLTGDTTSYQRINSGIKSNQITALAVDKSGNLLVGFYYGVMKFDMKKTWTMLWDDATNVTGIAADAANTIWVSSRNGAYKITKTSVTQLTGFPGTWINSVEIDSKGIKWFGTDDNGVIKYDNGILAVYNQTNSPLMNGGVNHIKFDKKGILWIASRANGLVRYDGSTWTAWNTSNSTISNDSPIRISVDNQNNIWIGNGAATKFDGTSFIAYAPPNSNYMRTEIRDIAFDANDNKWVGTENFGLLKYNDITFTKYPISNSALPADQGIKMAEDKNGIKWFATNSNYFGITSFDGKNWKTYDATNSGFTANHCWNIAFDAIGNTWCATWDGLFKFNGTTWTNIPSPNSIHNIAIDKSGLLWMTSNDEVMTYNGKNWQRYYLPNTGSLHDIAFDKTGICWVPDGGGLHKFNGTGFTYYTPSNSNLPVAGLTSMAIDADNNMWVGTVSGLLKFNGTNWTVFDTTNSPLPYFIRHVTVDRHSVWMSTSTGLARFLDGSWTIYNQNDFPISGNVNTKSSATVHSISIDNSGNKWIATASDGGFIVIKDDMVLGVENLEQATSFVNLYPNPTQDVAIVSFKNEATKKYTFSLYDIAGKEVLLIDDITTSTIKVNLQGISKGMYSYKLMGATHLIGTGKLIRQ